MVIIQTPAITKSIEEWRDRLLEISVGHKIEIEERLDTPQLTHNSEICNGEKEIDDYIEELEDLIKNWCRCACED